MTKEQRKYYYRGWAAALCGAGICRDCRRPHKRGTTRCAKCSANNYQRYERNKR